MFFKGKHEAARMELRFINKTGNRHFDKPSYIYIIDIHTHYKYIYTNATIWTTLPLGDGARKFVSIQKFKNSKTAKPQKPRNFVIYILQDEVGSFRFVFVFRELDVWRFVSWEPTVRFGSVRRDDRFVSFRLVSFRFVSQLFNIFSVSFRFVSVSQTVCDFSEFAWGKNYYMLVSLRFRRIGKDSRFESL